MSATEAQVARIRRLCNLAEDDATYTDDVLEGYIESHPVDDADGHAPDDAAWTATYDLMAAAADVCEELAAKYADKHDFTADGGTFAMSQQFEHYTRLASRYRGRRRARSVKTKPNRPYVLNEEVEEYNADQLDAAGGVSEATANADLVEPWSDGA